MKNIFVIQICQYIKKSFVLKKRILQNYFSKNNYIYFFKKAKRKKEGANRNPLPIPIFQTPGHTYMDCKRGLSSF